MGEHGEAPGAPGAPIDVAASRGRLADGDGSATVGGCEQELAERVLRL
jgi:hypothetical protein